VSRVAEQAATIHRSPEKCPEPLGRVIAQNGSCKTPYEAVHVEAPPTRFKVLPHRSVRPRDQIDRPQAEVLTSFLAYDLDPRVRGTSLSEATQTGSWTVSVSAKKRQFGQLNRFRLVAGTNLTSSDPYHRISMPQFGQVGD